MSHSLPGFNLHHIFSSYFYFPFCLFLSFSSVRPHNHLSFSLLDKAFKPFFLAHSHFELFSTNERRTEECNNWKVARLHREGVWVAARFQVQVNNSMQSFLPSHLSIYLSFQIWRVDRQWPKNGFSLAHLSLSLRKSRVTIFISLYFNTHLPQVFLSHDYLFALSLSLLLSPTTLLISLLETVLLVFFLSFQHFS